jgi:hypothetical protein
MALRALLFIAGLFGVRLYTLLGLRILHEHAPRPQTSAEHIC